MENKLIAHGTATENVDGKDDYGVHNKGMQIYHITHGVVSAVVPLNQHCYSISTPIVFNLLCCA